MTIALKIQVEQLRAELRNADAAEHRQTEAELDVALPEPAVAADEHEGTIDAAPPF